MGASGRTMRTEQRSAVTPRGDSVGHRDARSFDAPANVVPAWPPHGSVPTEDREPTSDRRGKTGHRRDGTDLDQVDGSPAADLSATGPGGSDGRQPPPGRLQRRGANAQRRPRRAAGPSLRVRATSLQATGRRLPPIASARTCCGEVRRRGAVNLIEIGAVSPVACLPPAIAGWLPILRRDAPVWWPGRDDVCRCIEAACIAVSDAVATRCDSRSLFCPHRSA